MCGATCAHVWCLCLCLHHDSLTSVEHDPHMHPHSLGGQQHVLAAVQFPRVSVLSAQVLGSCLGWELSLTDVAKVPSQVYGLSLQGGGQR